MINKFIYFDNWTVDIHASDEQIVIDIPCNYTNKMANNYVLIVNYLQYKTMPTISSILLFVN